MFHCIISYDTFFSGSSVIGHSVKNITSRVHFGLLKPISIIHTNFENFLLVLLLLVLEILVPVETPHVLLLSTLYLPRVPIYIQ